MDLNRKQARSQKTEAEGGLAKGPSPASASGLLARGNPFMIMCCVTMCCQRGMEGLPM